MNDLSFQKHFTEKVVNLKEELLKGVMKQVLGREPVLEDAKDFEFIIYKGREFIGHKTKGLLGEIVMFTKEDKENLNWQTGFTFVPKKNFSD